MLDVHAPEKMHGIRDFLLHILTITIGLFIALALEGLVERHHKNELREAAETNLRQEIQDNRNGLATLVTNSKAEQATLAALLDFVQAREQNKSIPFAVEGIGFSNTTLSDASWRTAQATGALALMDYKQVQDFAAAYTIQDETMRLERVTLDDFILLQSHAVHGFDPTKITPAQATAAEPEITHALAHLIATTDYARGLDQEYARALGQK